MKLFKRFKRWFTWQPHDPQAVFVDLELLNRCARIIRGQEPGREPRFDSTPFPAWGQANLEGRSLIWSGPFSFDLDIKYHLVVEALPGLYVAARTPDGIRSDDPDPLLTFIIGESATWATLWPKTDAGPTIPMTPKEAEEILSRPLPTFEAAMAMSQGEWHYFVKRDLQALAVQHHRVLKTTES